MSMEYIRRNYRVPVRLGAPVRFEGKNGRVCSVNGPYVRIRLDGETKARLYHPTWHITWLEENGPATRVPLIRPAPAPNWQIPATIAELVEPQWSGV